MALSCGLPAANHARFYQGGAAGGPSARAIGQTAQQGGRENGQLPPRIGVAVLTERMGRAAYHWSASDRMRTEHEGLRRRTANLTDVVTSLIPEIWILPLYTLKQVSMGTVRAKTVRAKTKRR